MTDPSPPAQAANPSAPPRGGVALPGWLAVLIVVLVAAGFGYLGWRMLRPPPAVDLSQYEFNDTRQRRFAFPGPPANNAPARPIAPAPPVNGVRPQPDGGGTADFDGLSIRFLPGAKPSLVSSARYPAPPDDRPALRARIVAMNDSAQRAAAGVTDDQLKKLRAIPPARPPQIDPAARAKLLDLWAKYQAAPAADRAGPEANLMAAVAEASNRGQAENAAAIHATAVQIQAVLSADQIGKLRAGR